MKKRGDAAYRRQTTWAGALSSGPVGPGPSPEGLSPQGLATDLATSLAALIQQLHSWW